MGKTGIIHLNVKTISAFDSETKMPHTAYTVYYQQGNILAIASAWTLIDAVTLFRKIHNINEQIPIRLIRPFKPQHSRR